MRHWFPRLVGWMLTQRRSCGATLALTVIVAGLQVAQPWPVKILLDSVLADASFPTGWGWVPAMPGGGTQHGLVLWLAALFILLFIARRVVATAHTSLKFLAGTRMSLRLGEQLFDKLQRQSKAFYSHHATGDLIRRVSQDTYCVRDLFAGVFIPLVSSVLTLGLIFAVTWQIDRWLTLATALTAMPMGFVIAWYARPMTERGYEQATQQGHLTATAERTLSAVPIVQAFNQEEREDQAYWEATGSALHAFLRSIATQLRFRLAVSAVTALGGGSIFLLGGYRAIYGALTVGDVYLFLSYLMALYAPLESMAYLSGDVATAKARGRRVFEMLDLERSSDRREVTEPPLASPMTGGAPRIAFDRVKAAYQPGHPILNGIDLTLEPGTTTALVGASGAGKTTLASLIPRLLDPTAGWVLWNGRDIRCMPLWQLRSQIAWVPQTPELLPGSVADNITFGDPNPDEARMAEAARQAGADTFIQALPDKYNTRVGQQNSRLSGGQTQRVAIARALYRRAKIFVFDEPTSALDPEMEAAVVEAIQRLTQDKTTIIIGHRLSTVHWAEQIATLQSGRVIEAGTFNELMEKQGEFHRLYRIQHPESPEDHQASTTTDLRP